MVSSLQSAGTNTTRGSEVPAGPVATDVACTLDEAIRIAKTAFSAVEAGGALVEQLRGTQLDHDTLSSIFELAERQHVDLQMCLAELRQAIGCTTGGAGAGARMVAAAKATGEAWLRSGLPGPEPERDAIGGQLLAALADAQSMFASISLLGEKMVQDQNPEGFAMCEALLACAERGRAICRDHDELYWSSQTGPRASTSRARPVAAEVPSPATGAAESFGDLRRRVDSLQSDACELTALVKTLRDLQERDDRETADQRGWIASTATKHAQGLVDAFDPLLADLTRAERAQEARHG